MMKSKVEPLEAFTLKELDQMELPQINPLELGARLLACDSVVSKDGAWKYDKVPADLVQDLLCYLQSQGGENK